MQFVKPKKPRAGTRDQSMKAPRKKSNFQPRL